jgi:hypothetical protein
VPERDHWSAPPDEPVDLLESSVTVVVELVEACALP